jgi:hypothetical protein
MTSWKKSESLGAQDEPTDKYVYIALLCHPQSLQQAAKIDQIKSLLPRLLIARPTSIADSLYWSDVFT